MKRPSFQMYQGDWLSNAKLRRCSFALRGIWIDAVCLMADSDEHGVLRWPLKELANALGCPLKMLQELRDKGVLKGADAGEQMAALIYTPRHAGKDGDPITLLPAQPGPCWYSSRMVRDEYKRANTGVQTRFGPKPAPQPITSDTERARLRAAVLSKTDGHCHHCKAKLGARWEIDHFIPRAKGGRHIFSNLVPACVGCNQDKSDTMPEDWSAPQQREGSSPSRREGDGAIASTSSSEKTLKAVKGGKPPPADGFEIAWQAYPKRSGNNPRAAAERAYRARLAAGIKPAEILDGVGRYARYCLAMGKVGTEYVMRASTFLGPDEPFAQTWAVANGSSDWRRSPDTMLAKAQELGISTRGLDTRQLEQEIQRRLAT